MAEDWETELDEKPVKTRKRPEMFDEKGLFKKGNPGGPGRPKGSLDFMTIARALEKRTGHSLDKAVEISLRALTKAAAGKDILAIKTLLDRLCGPLEKGPTVNVGVDARTAISAGPPMPEGADFREYAVKLMGIAEGQKLLGGTTTAQIVDAAVVTVEADEADELEDLLS